MRQTCGEMIMLNKGAVKILDHEQGSMIFCLSEEIWDSQFSRQDQDLTIQMMEIGAVFPLVQVNVLMGSLIEESVKAANFRWK